MNKLHLSIGSNIENRLEHIESAYQKIKSELGSITHYSKIYQSPSWGFSSTPFLNSCIILETDKTTEQVLDLSLIHI